MYVTQSNSKGFSVKAWQGDAKTLLAFNFTDPAAAVQLAGFTIWIQPGTLPGYYLYNSLELAGTGNANVATEPSYSTVNAPIQKFRWLHVPGNFHQQSNIFYGNYTYIITPRYFDTHGLLLPVNNSNSVSVEVPVNPFTNNKVELGFTRGFTQSQAFTRHFGAKASFKPEKATLLFSTDANAGTDATGAPYTYLDEYVWSGFTARQKIFGLLNEVVNDKTLSVDVFAYDLNEPDILNIFLQLADEKRIRIILDNASLHTKKNAPEDAFEKLFKTKSPDILRGKFGRFAHDKEFIVYKSDKPGKKTPLKVLTGSTNFSVTGMYVNSNHVIIFKDPEVAATYADVFAEVWDKKVSETFNKSDWAGRPYIFEEPGSPAMSITFSPHQESMATDILNSMANRIKASTSSVLFAVMDINSGAGPVFPVLRDIHSDQNIFSYGISDSPGAGIYLYKPGNKTGVLVGGKPGKTILPPPFNVEKAITLGHQVHNKFIICDFNTDHAVVWCGSSNLALGGEKENGDNLIQIQDADIAVVFAIEAVALVDHFDFRNAQEAPKAAKAPKAVKGSDNKTAPAASKLTTLYLYDNDSWAKRYFDSHDLHCLDRELFA